MTTRRKLAPLMYVGLFLLIIANLAKWASHGDSPISAYLTDGTIGFLYGISIGCMLIGLYRSRHKRDGRCA